MSVADRKGHPTPVAPIIAVVMGVSGSGKSTVGALLAERLGCVFIDGDALHSPDAIARMRAGIPLDDTDRAPWLARIAAWIDARLAAHESGVIACSALRRRYREAIVRGRPDVRVIYLEGEPATIVERSSMRRGHFMPLHLIKSQFDTLEVPGPDENPITVGIAANPDHIAATIAARLGLSER